MGLKTQHIPERESVRVSVVCGCFRFQEIFKIGLGCEGEVEGTQSPGMISTVARRTVSLARLFVWCLSHLGTLPYLS